jgi:hypothetical protein
LGISGKMMKQCKKLTSKSALIKFLRKFPNNQRRSSERHRLPPTRNTSK